MDQLKKQLAGVLRYGFWIGCVVVLCGSLAVWFLSTGDLNAQNESQERKITSEVNKVSQLRGELDSQPNEDSHTKMQEMIDKRKKEVLNAWQLVYNKQTKLLTWPDDITEAYVDEFRYVRDSETQQIDKKKLKLPFELYVNHGPDGYQAQSRILRGYAKYIGIELPKLAQIAKAKWTADFEAKAGASEGMEMNMQQTQRKEVDVTGLTQGPLVRWSSGSQEALMTDLFPWRGSKPSTLQVYYSQESLWILRQMLQIIAEINGDARQPFEANIHEIVQLSIGKSVAFGAGNIALPGSESKGGEGFDEMMSGMDGGMDGGMSDTGGFGEMTDTYSSATDPGDNRYLNIEDKHITGAELRSALTSNSPTDAPIAVAKRVPVKMVVRMDQRFVPDLIAACGSAPLMVEVKQTRILPSNGASAAGPNGANASQDEGMMDEMMMGAAAPSKEEEFPLDMLVEVYGLIYMYNPPNEEALGIEQVIDEVVIDKDEANAEVNAALPAPTADPSAPADPGATADPTTPADPEAPADPATPADPGATATDLNTPTAIGSPAALVSP